MLTEGRLRVPCDASLPPCEASHLGAGRGLKAPPGSAVSGSGVKPRVLLRQHGHVLCEVSLARAATFQ
eukprot:10652798-Prorocentrum_lima.AAC.1